MFVSKLRKNLKVKRKQSKKAKKIVAKVLILMIKIPRKLLFRLSQMRFLQ